MPKKPFASGAAPRQQASPKKSTFVFGLRPQFLALGG